MGLKATTQTNYSEGLSIKNARRWNMDGVLISEKIIDGQKLRLLAVCDGVGSTADGGYAASAVLLRLDGWFQTLSRTERLGVVFLDSVRRVSEAVTVEIEEKNLQAATTLSALLLTEKKYYIVHLGDSRIYGFQSDKIVQMTQDTVSESGALSAYIGRPDSAVLQYYEGDNTYQIYLLCSDGLYKRLGANVFLVELHAASQKNLKKLVERLVRLAVSRGEKDNISVAVTWNGGWK